MNNENAPSQNSDIHNPEDYQNVAEYWEACEAVNEEPLTEVMRAVQMQVGQMAV